MLNNFFSWLNQNQGATSVLLTAVYVIATIVLVVITVRGTAIAQRSLEAAHRFEQERSRPFVSLTLLNQPLGIIQMVVENIGATAAYDIRFAVEPVIRIVEGQSQSDDHVHVDPPEAYERDHPFITKGLAFLPPKAREQNLIAMSLRRFEEVYPQQRFTGTVFYADARGQRYEDPILIDLSTQTGLGFISEPDVAEELQKIRELLEKRLGKEARQ